MNIVPGKKETYPKRIKRPFNGEIYEVVDYHHPYVWELIDEKGAVVFLTTRRESLLFLKD